MDVRVEDAGPCRRVMFVQAPAERVAPEYETVLKAYAKSAKVPGFRPGRAPINVVERHYAKSIAEDAKDRLVPTLYREALEHKKVTAVAIVDVRDVSFAKQDGLTFKVTIDVPPDFKLPKYKKITLKSQTVSVTDEDLDQEFERLMEGVSRYEDVTGRPVQDKDLVRIDYTGRVNGEPIVVDDPSLAGIAEGKDFWLLCGGTEFIPGLARGLIGAAIEETREIKVLLPKDFRVKALAEKEAVYETVVRGVRQKVRPELNEEFLKRFDVDSEAALKQKIRGDLLAHKEREEQERLKNEIAKFLLEKTEFDLPQTIVDQETNLTIRHIVDRIVSQGATREQLEAQQSAIYNSAVETSRERVKLSYILSRIADEEQVAVEESEVQERLEGMAARYGMSAERLRGEIEKRNGLEGLKSDIRSNKTLARLLDYAKIKKA